MILNKKIQLSCIAVMTTRLKNLFYHNFKFRIRFGDHIAVLFVPANFCLSFSFQIGVRNWYNFRTIFNKNERGREPWSSGYGRRLMFQKSWVQIRAPYAGWPFFTFICCKILMFVRKAENKRKRGRDGLLKKDRHWKLA